MIIKKMKLKELRQYLTADRLNLCLEVGVPIKFEIWRFDDETNKLAEYRYLNKIDIRKNDTMLLDYGDYFIDEIGTKKDGAMYIGISK